MLCGVRLGWDISGGMAPATNNDNDSPSYRHHRRQPSLSLECWNAASSVVCSVNLLIVVELTWETGAGGGRADLWLPPGEINIL